MFRELINFIHLISSNLPPTQILIFVIPSFLSILRLLLITFFFSFFNFLFLSHLSRLLWSFFSLLGSASLSFYVSCQIIIDWQNFYSVDTLSLNQHNYLHSFCFLCFNLDCWWYIHCLVYFLWSVLFFSKKQQPFLFI